MEIIMVNTSKLKIILNRRDIADLGFECDHIHQNPRSREILIDLLEKGREQTGFHPSRAKLIVEVLPHEQGGCVICFTALHDAGDLSLGRRGMQPVVFEFEDADTLIEGGSKAFAHYSHRIYKSSLYRYQNRYRLIIYPLDYSDRLSVYFLSEYGERIGEGEVLAAYTEEHGSELIRDTALDTLAQYFGGPDTANGSGPPAPAGADDPAPRGNPAG